MLRAQRSVVADLVHPVLVPCSDCVILDLACALVDEGGPSVVLVRVVIFRVLETADGLAEVGRGVCTRTLEIHSCAVLGAVSEGFVGQFDEIVHAHEIITLQGARCDTGTALIANNRAFSAAFLGGDDDDSVRSSGSV